MKQTQSTGKKYFTTWLVLLVATAFILITVSSFTIYRTGEDLFKQLGIAKIDAEVKGTYAVGTILGYVEASEADAARFQKRAPQPPKRGSLLLR